MLRSVRIISCAVLASVAFVPACDGGSESADPGVAASGGKADEADTDNEEFTGTEGSTSDTTGGAASGPLQVHVEVTYDCGEMGGDAEPVDDDTVFFDEDEFEFRIVMDVEVPESCAQESSADCRVSLPSQCWSTSLFVGAGRVSASASAGDDDSSMGGRVPFSALTGDPADVEFESSPDNASGSFGSITINLSR